MATATDSSSSDSDGDFVRSIEVTESPRSADLIELLECPVCFGIPLPPIRTCNIGHILCKECCPKLSGCPLCLTPITNGRNFFAEDFINKSLIRCKYNLDGCQFISFGCNIRDHMLKCLFRPIRCHYCNQRVLFSVVEEHLQKRHRISKWDINENGDNLVSFEKRQRQRQNINCAVGNGNEAIFILKTLLAVFAFSFFADQICDFYDFTSGNLFY